MACYSQPLMLKYQLDTIAAYPQHVRERLNVIVVDDCGDPPVALGTIACLDATLKSATLLRITKDIPWNQMGARNLGMHHASGVCLMIDPDMVFDEVMMESVIISSSKLERGRVIKFGIKPVLGSKVDMTSPNTWIIHRDDFFSVGGYAEHYAGSKGWSDCTLMDVLVSSFKVENRPDIYAAFHDNRTISDAMVTSLNRDVSANKKKRIKDTHDARKLGGWAKWAKARLSIPRLNFPWVQVYPQSASSGKNHSEGMDTGSTT